MKKVKILVVCSLIINFLTFNISQALIQADVKSERIPAGTAFNVRMETPVNSYNYSVGDTFRSTLLDDIRIGRLIVLPAGTALRGTLDRVKPAGFFCRGGELNLRFDHAVTPFGKQIQLSVKTTKAINLKPDGTFSAGGGYMNALDKNFDKGSKILTTTSDYMYNLGKSFWKGIPVVATAPLGVFAGAFGGGGYFTGKSVYDMFQKGNDLKINPGDIIEVTLTEPLDVPTN